ncbi:MAG TPA: transketolase [Candidatus Omnitrophota bacterium]|nr:transketolase [Candidatus Omnitrophota bacterium]
MDVDALKKKALQYRKEILRILNSAGSGHPGGSLSAVEIFISLYDYKMNHRPGDPAWEDRDRLIVSKGHITPTVYVTLADQGYFPKEELDGFRKFGSRLQGHVHTKAPGVEFNTGSLGHGLSVANGIAMGAKMLKKDFKTYCLMGDGELQEGSVWEAAMTAAHHKLDNVCAIIDYNKIQENDFLTEVKNIEPLAEKWRSFGWHAVEAHGHHFKNFIEALDQFGTVKDKPFVIIAHTIKGKGVSFMEGERKWHGKAPNDKELAEALSELDSEQEQQGEVA